MPISKALDERIFDNLGDGWLGISEIHLDYGDYAKLKAECDTAHNYDFDYNNGIPRYRGVRLVISNEIKPGKFRAITYFQGEILSNNEKIIKDIIE